jgi:hypothetical protein
MSCCPVGTPHRPYDIRPVAGGWRAIAAERCETNHNCIRVAFGDFSSLWRIRHL